MRFKLLSLLIICIIVSHNIIAQTCNALGQNPGTAFPVCGTANLTQNNVPICGGRDVAGPCGAGLEDVNPFWYRFTCYTAGTLGFLITPNNLADDYDWQVFDITNRNPNDIYTDASTFVACNWSGFGGVTGASAAGTSLIRCGGNVPIFSSMPNLIVGHEYLLLISHFTNTQSGYTLSFTGGTAGIVDPANPIPGVLSASPTCDGQQVIVRFTKPVKCNSLAANGSDFTVAGATVTGATGFGCSSSFDMDSALVTLSAPLAPGNSSVAIAQGSDGNTLLDNCNNAIPVGEKVTFTYTAQPPMDMGTVGPLASCIPSSIVINFAEPVRCNTIAANGSDFVITGPAAVTITGATYSCNGSGETSSITLQFSAPAVTPGTYTVAAATGTDGNTVIGACNRSVVVGDGENFTVPPQTPLPMGTLSTTGCTPAAATLTLTDAVLCSSIAANGSDFTITGPSAVTITGATATCNGAGEATTITIQFSAPLLTPGNYTISIATGSDGNTLVGQCNRSITAGDNSSFTIAAQAPLPMGTIPQPPCIPASVTINFTDPILCSSLAANGSDFFVTGPSAVTVTGATATCNGSGETTSITIQFSGPILTPGNYAVAMASGSDGNTLIGQCNRRVNAGDQATFTLAAQPPIAMGTIPQPPCIPSSVTINFTDPVLCSSLAANGSDFVVTGPSAVTVTGATATCNGSGETTSITIQFSGPILTPGNYAVAMASGSDGNTLIGQCNRRVNAGDQATFTLAAQPPIAMGTVPAQPCSPSSITLTFADNINCASLAANGSDFTISGASPVTITGATATCNGSGQTNAITLQFSGPITVNGNYTITVATGSDNTTLTGDCNRILPAGQTVSFAIPDVPPVPMNTMATVGCSPATLRLTFPDNIRCSSVAANGSDFTLAGSSGITITGATATCDANGFTKAIDLQLSGPIVIGGPYTVTLGTGNDNNTLLSECYRSTPAGSSVSFTASDTVSAEFDVAIVYDCQDDEVTFTHDGAHNVNSWIWTVNGVAANNTASFTRTFSADSRSDIKLTVSNGVCSDEYTYSLVLDNKVTAAFNLDNMACPGDEVLIENTSSGPIDNWQWSFGNGNTSTVKDPPAQVYPTTGVDMPYTITLTASNPDCSATLSKVINIFGSCIIAVPTAFTPNNDGKNDYLFPLNAFKAENLDFKVFNRWGQLVFRSRDWTQKWDGRIGGIMQNTGVYVWMLDYIHKDTKQRVSQRGTTTLIR